MATAEQEQKDEQVALREAWWTNHFPNEARLTFRGKGGTGNQYGGGCGGGYDPTWTETLTIHRNGRLKYSISGMDDGGFSYSRAGEGLWEAPDETAEGAQATTVTCKWTKRDRGIRDWQIDLAERTVYLAHSCSR